MEPVNESPQSPRVLGNRYEVGDILGRGGMAEVHLGRDTRLGRVVAIKLLRTDLARDPMFQARFRREAQSAAGLNHPAIVAVYDTGEETVVESGGGSVALPYIVMEYVEGRTLRDILREGRPMEVQQALEVTAGVLSALDYSHRMGIVHRDIKPANVMLTAGGDIKVMDFGIARALADVSATMTQTQAVIGTAQYLSPEQARGETVDARSDLYSAGCLLYELMTDRPPFVADSPVAVAYQHVREIPQPPSAHNSAIPEVVDRIVLHALAKDREARYQTAAEFRGDVEAAVAGRAVAAALTAPHQGPGGRAAGGGATTEYLPQSPGGTTRAMPPLAHTMPHAPVGPGHPGGAPGPVVDAAYARRGDRRPQGTGRTGGTGSGRQAGFIALAVAVVAIFAVAAYGVSHLVGQNSAANAPVVIPQLEGRPQKQAVKQLNDLKLSVLIFTEPSSKFPEGMVIRSEPAAGKKVTVSDEVKLVVSSGSAKVTIPDVSRQSQEQARDTLTRAGLVVEAVTDTVDGKGIPKDVVVGTDPAIGKQVDGGSKVALQISNGKVTIPSMVGMTKDDAVAALGKAGYVGVVTVLEMPSDRPANEVIEQDPQPGTSKGGEIKAVKLYVAVPNGGPADNGQPGDSGAPFDGGQGQGNNGQNGGNQNGGNQNGGNQNGGNQNGGNQDQQTP
jgi:beta-lactam-binding protein with PASTA domain/predicted Ser/Thr protein kinase